jgi:outer membrane protein OmpA-like peptidoglycan-associated protein
MRAIGRLALLMSVLVVGRAHAAPPAEYSPNDFVKAILSGPQPCPKGRTLEACEANPKTRRFTLATSDAADAASPRRARLAGASHASGGAHPARLSAADVLVTFALGSAEITEQGQANLHSIAQGLNTPALAGVAFEVAGFTDVTGSVETNRALSQRRADAVKAYLVSLNVQASRLSTAGYGADHLADPTDPTSEANRRVELHRQN